MMHENVSKAHTPATPELEKSCFILFLFLVLRLYLAQAHQKAGVDSAGSQVEAGGQEFKASLGCMTLSQQTSTPKTLWTDS